MSEITKLYENAGIKAKWKDKRVKNTKTYYTEEQAKYLRQTTKNRNIQLLYPPFTAEKQIELIKWMVKINYSDERIINCYDGNYYCSYSWDDFNESELFKTYEEALACAINYIWQDLTEEEKQQVKGILE